MAILILQITSQKPNISSLEKKNHHLRKIAKKINDTILNSEKNNIHINDEKDLDENFTIIEDIKNLDIKPLDETFDSLSEEILSKNKTKKKIGIAFPYYSLHANGIGRFITVTANNLMKTGKYDICFITEKPPSAGEFSYDPKIKRFVAYNNYTLIQNISKHENIDIIVLQNVLSSSLVQFHRKLGQRVICMFHGVFLSAIVHNLVEHYKNWDKFDV